MQYFGSNIEGVAESRVKAKMSWVEVGVEFSNTLKDCIGDISYYMQHF